MTLPLGWTSVIAADARPLDDGRRGRPRTDLRLIAEIRPESARRVAQSVVERIGTLKTFPHLGRIGRVQGTREIAFPPLPFIAIYEVFETYGEVRVLRILHGAQQWPPR